MAFNDCKEERQRSCDEQTSGLHLFASPEGLGFENCRERKLNAAVILEPRSSGANGTVH